MSGTGFVFSCPDYASAVVPRPLGFEHGPLAGSRSRGDHLVPADSMLVNAERTRSKSGARRPDQPHTRSGPGNAICPPSGPASQAQEFHRSRAGALLQGHVDIGLLRGVIKRLQCLAKDGTGRCKLHVVDPDQVRPASSTISPARHQVARLNGFAAKVGH